MKMIYHDYVDNGNDMKMLFFTRKTLDGWEGLGYIKYKNKLHLLSLTDGKQDVFLPWFGFRKCLFKKNFDNRQKKKRTKSQKENNKKVTKNGTFLPLLPLTFMVTIQ